MESILITEGILKMQKLSGIITESEYKKQLKTINKFENSFLSEIVNILQKEYINNLNNSNHFTSDESKYLKEYFNKYDKIDDKNIIKHNNILSEGFIGDVGKFFSGAWNKIKQVYGNIKNFVLKIWEFLRNSAVRIGNASYTFIKNQLTSKRQAMAAYLAKIQDKQGLSKEVGHCKEIFQYLNNLIKSFWNTLTNKLTTNPELNDAQASKQLAEIFNNKKVFKLFENIEGGGLSLHPEDLIKNPLAKNIVTFIMTTLKIVLNPYASLFVYLTNFYIGKSFQITNFIVNKIGGPAIINWVILPPMMTVVMENLPSIHHQLEDKAMELLAQIVPYAKELVETAGVIYFVYGWYEFCAGLANM
jgi:hypothetical protein